MKSLQSLIKIQKIIFSTNFTKNIVEKNFLYPAPAVSSNHQFVKQSSSSQMAIPSHVKGRILLIGWCCLDVVQLCETYPSEDQQILTLDGYWQRGGNASNSSTILRILGAEVEYFGTLSDSEVFAFLITDMKNRGIHYDLCPRSPLYPPFSSILLVAKNDTRTIIHTNKNWPVAGMESFGKIDLSKFPWIHFEARNLDITMDMIKHVHEYNQKNENKIIISVELEEVLLEDIPMAEHGDLVVMGKDLSKFLGYKDCKEACYGLRERLNQLGPREVKQKLVCTWGDKGSCCLDENDQFHHANPYPPKEAVDGLGAGDTYMAGLLYGLYYLQMSLPNAIDFANRCAGFKIGVRGYDPVKEFRETDIAFK